VAGLAPAGPFAGGAVLATPPRIARDGVTAALVVRNDIHRFGLEGMLRSLDVVSGIESYPTIPCAVDETAPRPFDVLLTSVRELDALAGPEPLDRLRERGARVLALAGPADRLEPAWASRVHGIVDQTALHLDALREAILDVGSNRFHVPPSLVQRLLSPAGPGSGAALTARELQLLRLVADGLSNKQAARDLGISENGVKRLMSTVMAKLNSPNRTLAVVRAMEVGLLKPL
jgi:DNA-binding NarL/FixJ family response regulator